MNNLYFASHPFLVFDTTSVWPNQIVKSNNVDKLSNAKGNELSSKVLNKYWV